MADSHDGHRKRLRERFLKNGLESFKPHEVLELLLTYSIPRKNTNVIAHRLIDKFGSISGVCSADIDSLTQLDGITENSAVLLKMIPQIIRLYKMDINKTMCLSTIENVESYFTYAYLGSTVEEFKVCCLDNNLYVISCDTISTGDNRSVKVSSRCVAEAAFRASCSNIIVSHNHPGAYSKPSERDISFTRELKYNLKGVGIDILDHVIVGKDGATSMKHSGFMPLID